MISEIKTAVLRNSLNYFLIVAQFNEHWRKDCSAEQDPTLFLIFYFEMFFSLLSLMTKQLYLLYPQRLYRK